jgi:uncharacterized membrane protein
MTNLTKNKFAEDILSRLQDYPQSKVKEQLDFYLESISDRMEDGMSEEDAVRAVGDPEEIAENIRISLPLTSLAGSAIKQSRDSSGNKRLWTVLAIIGSPIWLSLAIALAALIIAFYAVIWSVAVSLWAAEASLALGGAAVFCHGIVRIFGGEIGGIMVSGCGIFIAGLAIILFMPFVKGTVYLGKFSAAILKFIKSLIFHKKKGDA